MGIMSLPEAPAIDPSSLVFARCDSSSSWTGMTITAIGLALWRGRLMRVSVGCGVIIAMLLVAMDVADVLSRVDHCSANRWR